MVTTRRGVRPALILFMALGALRCGGSSDPGAGHLNPPVGDGGGGIIPALDGGTSPVTIEIVKPEQGAILPSHVTADVEARITLGSNAEFINPAGVVAELRALTSGAIVSSAPLTGAASVFTGRLGLTDIPTGAYVLVVSAASSSGRTTEVSRPVTVDAGPIITVLSPQPGGHHRGSLTVDAIIDASPYGPPTIEGSIGGIVLDLQEVVAGTNEYRATADFKSVDPPLAGEQLLVIAATNTRGVRTEVRVRFVIDETGPTITATTPDPGAVVGGVVRIAATIADSAGLLGSSIFAVITDDVRPLYRLELKPEGNGVYSVSFDTAKLLRCVPPQDELCIVFPTLSFRASDLLGNETVLAYEIAVDNIPPVIDLDPPMMRDIKMQDGWRCSWEFDPLSTNVRVGQMPDDGCAVPQVFDLRALVADDGHHAVGLKLVPIAAVAPDAVAAYVLDDTSQPLVVDSNGDGYCDAVNPNLVPTTQPPTGGDQVLKVRLSPVPPAGKADFTPDPSLASSPEYAGYCLPGDDLDAPLPVCGLRPLEPTIVIGYSGRRPVIWSIDPIDGQHCVGGQFDTLANRIEEGWACLAVAATDQNGNAGVSAPMRVWVDYELDQSDRSASPFCPSPITPDPAPNCTGTIIGGQVTATPCRSREVRAAECLEGNCGFQFVMTP